jgi:hypothetical protein
MMKQEVMRMESENTHLIFYYPFSYRRYDFNYLQKTLKENQFFHFHVEQKHSNLYGPDVEMSHDLLKQFYYPFIEEKLLNDTPSLVHFNRYSKAMRLLGTMKTKYEEISFTIHSVDVNLCPFGIGIVAIRLQLHAIKDINSTLSFMHYFRVLQPTIDEELGADYMVDEQHYDNSNELLFSKLVPFLPSFFVDYQANGKNYRKIPFFEDERMYVSGFLQVDETMELNDEVLFRAGQLNGRNEVGAPYISSTNETYIENFVKEHCYDRWSPNFFMMTTIQGQIQLTNRHDEHISKYISNFHSTTYYTVLIHYFYKLVLLKLTFQHSELKFSKDKVIVEDLIEQITKFATRYYFSEVSARTEANEVAYYFRKVFKIDEQYREIKETLDELYRIQEDRSNDRLNELLFILTIFSMISGIYGMNLVIEKLGKSLDWSEVFNFTFYEWSAFLLIIFGLAISALLVIHQSYSLLSSYYKKKTRHKKY